MLFFLIKIAMFFIFFTLIFVFLDCRIKKDTNCFNLDFDYI